MEKMILVILEFKGEVIKWFRNICIFKLIKFFEFIEYFKFFEF